jgi:hypothetical protein
MTSSDAKARTEVDMSINVSSSERRRMTPSWPSRTLPIYFGLVLLFAVLVGCTPAVSSGGEILPPIDSGIRNKVVADAAGDTPERIDIGSLIVDVGKPLPDVPTPPDRPSPPADLGSSSDRPIPTTDLGSTSPDRTAPPTCVPSDIGSVVGSAVARGTTTGRSPLLDTDGCGVPMGGTRGGTNAPEAVFRWAAPQAGTFVIDTAGSQFDTLLYVRAGGCQGLELACNDNVSTAPQNTSSRVSVALAQGESIVIIVDGFGSESGAYQLNINSVGSGGDGGAVDVFVPRDTPAVCSAVDLGGRTGLNVAQGTTTGRAAVLDVSNCGAAPGSTRGGTMSPEAVYTWTAPSSDTYTFDTVGSAFDTILYLRQGDCTGSDLLCNDDIDTASNMVASRVRLPLPAGQRVTIVVDGYNGASGPFSLSITRGGGTPDAGTPVCGSGESLCAGRCVNTATDVTNCGGCAVACSTGQRCNSGRCESSTPRWTIFVYGHGDHNLSTSLFVDIAEMSVASLNPSISVVVYTDWNAMAVLEPTNLLPLWRALMPMPLGIATLPRIGSTFPSGSYWLQINGNERPPTLLSSEPERNLDDPSVFAEAVRSAFTRFPADRYGVILWDHGGSWRGGFGGDTQNGTVVGTGMSPTAVAGALRSGLRLAGITSPRPLEFVAFDTCLMGAAEVAYPFRDLAQVFIAEAELDFGAGWDYGAALNLLANNPAQTVQQFARSEMTTWAAHHAGTVGSADALIRSRVALDLNQMDAFASSARSFATSLLSDPAMTSPNIARAVTRSNPTYSPSIVPQGGSDAYRDLGQFLDAVRLLPISPSSLSAADALSRNLDTLIIARDQGSRRSLARQRGLQIALPVWNLFSTELESVYRSNASDWSTATRWSEVVTALNPGTIPRPDLNPVWSNTTNANGSLRPQVLFGTSGEVAQSETRVFRLDPAPPNASFEWQFMGVVATGSIDPGLTYRYVWDGQRTELPDGQAIMVLPYLTSTDVGMMTSYSFESSVGVCGIGNDTIFSCVIVWSPSDMTTSFILNLSRPASPSITPMTRFAADGNAFFIPLRYYRSSELREDLTLGRPIPLPSNGRLTLRRARTPAGTFQFIVRVRDVYGRVAERYQIVTTAVPYGP